MTLMLDTPRLRLRPFCDADYEPFLAYRNDPLVYRYQGWKVPYLPEYARDFIEKMKMAVPGTPGEWYQLAIVPRESTGIMIGDVAYHVTRTNPRLAYIGYTLMPQAWGHGFANEAVRRLLDYLFRVVNLHRVVAECDVENLASVRLLERLGFRREGHYLENFWLGQDSTWGSEYLYAILQREWLLA